METKLIEGASYRHHKYEGDLDFKTLWDMRPETDTFKKAYGKTFRTPRRELVYGRELKYSGVTYPAVRIPDFLQATVDDFSAEYKCKFNMVLINFYADGQDCVGAHRDNEKERVPGSPVVCLSLGASRRFWIRKYKKPKKRGEKRKREAGKKEKPWKRQFVVADREVYAMLGPRFQQDLTHEIPRESKKTGARISITLRVYK